MVPDAPGPVLVLLEALPPQELGMAHVIHQRALIPLPQPQISVLPITVECASARRQAEACGGGAMRAFGCRSGGMADAVDLNSTALGRGGSNPPFGTTLAQLGRSLDICPLAERAQMGYSWPGAGTCA